MSMRAVLSGQVFAALCFSAGAQTTLTLQVSDTKDHPMTGVIISAKEPSSVSPPTDVAGKTSIKVVRTLLPGEIVPLVLVQPLTPVQFLSPWEGRATVPQPQKTVEVVLGSRGDKQMLANIKVVAAAAGAIVANNDQHRGANGVSPPEKSVGSLLSVSKELGVSPVDLDGAIRRLADIENDLMRGLGRRYVFDTPGRTIQELKTRGVALKRNYNGDFAPIVAKGEWMTVEAHRRREGSSNSGQISLSCAYEVLRALHS